MKTITDIVILAILSLGFLFGDKTFFINIYDTYYVMGYSDISVVAVFIITLIFLLKNLFSGFRIQSRKTDQ